MIMANKLQLQIELKLKSRLQTLTMLLTTSKLLVLSSLSWLLSTSSCIWVPSVLSQDQSVALIHMSQERAASWENDHLTRTRTLGSQTAGGWIVAWHLYASANEGNCMVRSVPLVALGRDQGPETIKPQHPRFSRKGAPFSQARAAVPVQHPTGTSNK